MKFLIFTFFTFATLILIVGCEKTRDQLDMFSPLPQIVFEDMSSSILDELEKLDISNMTPMQAMNKLYELQKSYLN